MKKFILLAGVAALAACGETAVEEEAPTEDVVVDEVAEAPTAPDGGPMEGTYALRDMEGTEDGRTTLNADGTYNYVPAEGDAVSGTWEMTDAGVCFDPEGDMEATCYPMAEEVNEDGSWVRIDSEGNEAGTIIRVEA